MENHPSQRDFSIVLKEIRTDNNWSQEELAKRLRTSKQVISRYETGQRIPKITTAKEYAAILNVSLEYLIGVVPDKKTDDSEEEQRRSLTLALRESGNGGKLSNEDEKIIVNLALSIMTTEQDGFFLGQAQELLRGAHDLSEDGRKNVLDYIEFMKSKEQSEKNEDH